MANLVLMAAGRHKLSVKIIGILVLFFVVAIVAIGMTLHLSWQLEGAAAAINDAGSERMRSYRIGYLLSRGAQEGDEASETLRAVRAEEVQFERVLFDLEHGDPARPLFVPKDPAILHDVELLKQTWMERVKPLITAILQSGMGPQREKMLVMFDEEVTHFVGNINGFVLKLEDEYARSTNLLRTSQLVLVALAIIGTGILIRFFFALVVLPVERLQDGIRRMAAEDFAVRLPVTARDEFGELALGFNRMAGHLEDLYATLEQRVEAKTHSLEEKNQELALLYEIATFLNEPSSMDELCRGFLTRLMRTLSANAGTVRLYDAKSQKLFLTVSEGLSEDFIDRETVLCPGECVCGSMAQEASPGPFVCSTERPPKTMTLYTCRREGLRTASAFPISYNKRLVGIFNLYFTEHREFSRQEIHLLETLGQHLGVTVENQQLKSREKHLAIAEERNLLAQELHDSIAQGLAFLNLQAQLLDESLRQEHVDEALKVAGRIREGINESYEDVRELLVHFRTRVGQTDLDTAINKALQRLSEQTSLRTIFERKGNGVPLAPDAEVQVLHIVQEALSNARKHAQASEIRVAIDEDSDGFRLTVKDDGIGFDPEHRPAADSDDHIGLKIMKERASRIGGDCRVESHPGGGTEVQLTLASPRKELV